MEGWGLWVDWELGLGLRPSVGWEGTVGGFGVGAGAGAAVDDGVF